MTKIVSRADERDKLLAVLQQVVRDRRAATYGDEVPVEGASTWEELVAQVDRLLADQLLLIECLRAELEDTEDELAAVKIELQIADELNSRLVGDISYDSCLDEAVSELMQSLVAHGLADFAPDGQVVLDARALVGRAELKPILRDAIIVWLDRKLSDN